MPRPAGRAGGALAVLAAVALLAGCTPGSAATPTPTPPPASGDGVLRIGTLFSTSGPGAATAPAETAGVFAAVRAINAAGGVGGAPVEVISRDGGTAGDGKAEAGFAELVERGADIVVGPSSMEVAAVLLPLAREAGVPLLTGSARGDRPEGSEDVLFRLVPSLRDEGAAIAREATDAGAGSVAVVRSDDPAAQALEAGLSGGLEAAGAELTVSIVAGDDPAEDARAAADGADAVVVATADAGEGTAALLAALRDEGVAADRIWVAHGAYGRYDALGDAVAGVHSLVAGISTDPGFVAAIRQEDPGAGTRLAPGTFDAVVLAALAAELAGDEGGPSIAAFLPAASADGIACRSFGECLAVLDDRPDIRYQGVAGDLALTATHDRAQPGFTRFVYDERGRPVVAAEPTG